MVEKVVRLRQAAGADSGLAGWWAWSTPPPQRPARGRVVARTIPRDRSCAAAGLAAMLLLAGCSTNEPYERGRRLAREGDYDRAVAELRTAVRQDPGNSKYRIDLAETEMLAAERHLQTAESLLAENQATAAREHVAAAQGYVPGHPKAIQLAAQTDERIARGQELARQASSALAAREWREGHRLALEAARADAGGAEARLVLAEARSAAKAHGLAVSEEPPILAETRSTTRPAEAAPAADRRTRESREARLPARAGPPPREPKRPAGRPEPPPPSAAVQRPRPPAATSFRGILSRDDDRYPKKMETLDGIVVKLDDTDAKPLEADVTIRVGKYELQRRHVRIGMPIYGRGASGRSYRIVIEGIAPRSETIRFLVEAVSPAAADPQP